VSCCGQQASKHYKLQSISEFHSSRAISTSLARFSAENFLAILAHFKVPTLLTQRTTTHSTFTWTWLSGV
jgi:hypothetical protein